MKLGYWILVLLAFTFRPTESLSRRKQLSAARNTSSAILEEEVYSTWSPWRRCTRRCKQKRTRRCILPASCGTNLLREEKACFTDRCNTHRNGVDILEEVKKQQESQAESDFRILFHIAQPSPFSEWSRWSPCSRQCLTHRSKTCAMQEVCGERVLRESALCYVEDSECQRIYGNRARKRKKSGQASDPSLHHPLMNLQCGVSPMAGQMPDLRSKLRIIGGREAKRGSWPWQLSIMNRHREPFCGGTLISHSWVLTAAHCLRKRLIVRAGEHNLMTIEGTEQESPVSQTYVHPDYDADTVNNDIALLKLRKPFAFDNYTQPACLPHSGDKLETHARGVILGWGKRKNTAIYGTDHLHQAEVPVVDLSECRKSYANYPITDNMLCAGYKQGRVDSCAGDSGGPLLSQKDDKWTIYGITSFGDGCGQKGKYGIYSNVAKFIRWIRKTIAKHRDAPQR